jgi:DNA-binding XRE family transcriptional regulator
MRKRKRKRKPPPVWKKPGLYIEEILRWADAWKARTGSWPRHTSGRIPDSPGDKWGTVQSALYLGFRGLRGGTTLAQLLAEHRGVRNRQRLPHFEVFKILAWSDAHRRRTGEWPNRSSGPIPDAPGETWRAVEMALFHGGRGLPGGTTLARLLAKERGLRNRGSLPDLSEELILSWSEAHFRRSGAWPQMMSGAIYKVPGEKWHGVEAALRRGLRGLPGGSSLYQLLQTHGRVPSPQGLKRRRTAEGLSRRELGKRLGVAYATVVTWEQGRNLPLPAVLSALARIFAVPMEQLRAEMEAVRTSWRKKEAEKHKGRTKGVKIGD